MRGLERAADDFSFREALMVGTEGHGGGGGVLGGLRRGVLIGCVDKKWGMDSRLLTVSAVRPNCFIL